MVPIVHIVGTPPIASQFSGAILHRTLGRHTTVFKQDLCQLVKNLKELTFLDIHGEIDHEKVESYRLMAQRRFPNSRIDFDLSRFRLWL
ncbi:unnamed protein product [Rotaria socialis]|uniref:Uncharacterized protein n=1 Tax=Rotaria socialis TaxID=392032 RepID=A0A818GRC8_9BILA|nr:unnamed protein product [Rotaria socialis]